MRDYVLYNLARLGMLVVVVCLVWLIAGISLVSSLAGIVIATLLSYATLAGLRRKGLIGMREYVEAKRAAKPAKAPKANSDESVEDAALDSKSENAKTDED